MFVPRGVPGLNGLIMSYKILYNEDVIKNKNMCIRVMVRITLLAVIKGTCTQTVGLTRILGRFSLVTDSNGQQIRFCALLDYVFVPRVCQELID